MARFLGRLIQDVGAANQNVADSQQTIEEIPCHMRCEMPARNTGELGDVNASSYRDLRIAKAPSSAASDASSQSAAAGIGANKQLKPTAYCASGSVLYFKLGWGRSMRRLIFDVSAM